MGCTSVNSSVLTFAGTVFLLQNVVFVFFLYQGGLYSSFEKEDAAGIPEKIAIESKSPHLQDETNVPIPIHTDGSPMSTEDRLRYLELKVNAFMNFGTDPFFQGKRTSHSCKNTSNLKEYGCQYGDCPGQYDHWICLDHLPEPGTKYDVMNRNPPCLIYDFGIRKQPEFGEAMARTFGCEVHGFDPSPISKDWWGSDSAKKLREMPNYHFHPYGAGGTDGTITLKEYNWGQVSILRYPKYTIDCKNKTEKDTNCDMVYHESKAFQLPVKTLPTIIKELGHEGWNIDILKIDVEGSEYSFLENLFDSSAGCPSFVNQVSLEWHHFGWDSKYGEGSSPSINTIVTLMHACGLKNFWIHSQGGWPSSEKIFQDLDVKDVRYNLASFHRG